MSEEIEKVKELLILLDLKYKASIEQVNSLGLSVLMEFNSKYDKFNTTQALDVLNKIDRILQGKDEDIKDLQQQVDRRILEVKDWQKDTNKLEQQLKEKDLEIEMFKIYTDEKLKVNTHQVCEKVRECVKNKTYIKHIYNQALSLQDDILKLLDKIEKGE